MNESSIITTVHEFSSSSKRRFLLLIIGSIVITCIMVTVSMVLYNSSGAAQLDLSRPGYQSVRSQSVTNDNNFQTYSGVGSVNQSTIDEFKTLMDAQSQKVQAVDAFGGDPLSPDALGLIISN